METASPVLVAAWEREKDFDLACMHVYMCVCVCVCVYKENGENRYGDGKQEGSLKSKAGPNIHFNRIPNGQELK